jgi:hypothetical protein
MNELRAEGPSKEGFASSRASSRVGLAARNGSQLSPFKATLYELCEDPQIFAEPSSCALHRLLTYDGKLPFSSGLDALAELDRELFLQACHIPVKICRSMTMQVPGVTWIRVFYNALGRLHLRLESAALPDYGEGVPLLPIGFIRMQEAVYQNAVEAVVPGRSEEIALRVELDGLLEKIERSSGLVALLDRVDDAVRHVEAVYFYVDDELFSVMERISTLIPGDPGGGLLEALRTRALYEWSSAQRLCVAALRALFLSGKSIRFEEFNGRSLTARRLFARLRELAASYASHGIEVGLTDGKDLFTLAEAVGRSAAQSVGQRWIRCRWVTGLTYLKTEYILDDQRRAVASEIIPARIRNLYESWIGKPARGMDYQTLFADMTDCALAAGWADNLEMPEGTPAEQPLGALIQEIVTSAVVMVRADYGMSSSVRDIRPFLLGDPQVVLAAILELKPKDCYCCIVSRPGMRAEMGATIVPHVYRAVQNRMQFNRWHFLPGNFPEEWIPRSRHYYYPPTMPDTAEWSDQTRAGHTKAGVRYSIRSPGPDMGQPPLRIGVSSYRGFYDVRLARMDGPPFTCDEMLTTRHHCLWMGVVWTRIVAYAQSAAARLRPVVIKGFEVGDGYEPAMDEPKQRSRLQTGEERAA